jgi:soluble lytic murein transglycosylase-like protein
MGARARLLRTAAASLLTFAIAAVPGGPSIPDTSAGVDTSAGAGTGASDGIARLLSLRERLDPRRRKPRRPAERRPAANAAAGVTDHHHRCFSADVETAIATAARRYRIDPNLIRAVISVESSGNPHAMSSKGARGLMQVMPATGRDLGVHDPARLFDVSANVTAGTRYLRYTYDRFGNWPDALGAYNAGPGSISRGRVPTETRHYVRRVQARHRDYQLSRCG